ncbi:hypothetical protein [Billgrantia gudaonensis]|uniref:Uncharacterized protein n=1 Tax=Billgrantia gudaonensis TaxID=376427 RepID=A0A1G8UC31_9GAMM|nr:hypothetical protein [Halomonas gudaonensis]SDJ51282.1 hypothetical protein SAMN04487954_105135 [Halomonas gudaonensis]
MIWHLIAAVFAGLGAAGIGLLLRTLSAKRLPRWIVPVCAGLGILGYQIHHEYTWFEHKRAQLPDSARVVDTEQSTAFWRPWTFLAPLTTAFTVVDEQSLASSQSEADDQRLVEFILYRFEREYVERFSHQAYLMNCTTRELVPLEGESRTPRTDRLRRLDDSNPLFGAVCTDA